jgi:hypothetical protein
MKKFKISTVAAIAVYAMLAAVLSGCHNFIYEKESVVQKVENAEGYKDYKYKVFIDGFPTTQILWTNIPYQVGDTVKYCR